MSAKEKMRSEFELEEKLAILKPTWHIQIQSAETKSHVEALHKVMTELAHIITDVTERKNVRGKHIVNPKLLMLARVVR